MSTRPVIFISAVSKELRSARDLVAKTLLSLGYEPKWQDIAATDAGDLRGVLRKWVDDSAAVIQLVGHCYGFGPKTPDPDFGACSYTQYEALYARQQGKPVYYIFTDDAHPTDGCGCEPKTLHDLQEQYRQQVKAYGDLYHSSASLIQTELIIRRLKDDLAHLRAEGQKKHRSLTHKLALVLSLLLLIVLGIVGLKRDLFVQQQTSAATNQKVDVLHDDNAKLLQALRDLPQTLNQQPRSAAPDDEATRIARAYTVLETQLKLPPGSLAKELPQFAQQLLQRADTSALDRANALFATQKFAEAEEEALKAKDQALAAAGKPVQDAIAALRLAGQSAQAQIHYAQAMEHYRAATALTSKERDFLQWLDLQNAISYLYHLQGRYPEGLTHTQAVWQAAQQAGKNEAPAVLKAHMLYASALWSLGQAVAAEPEYQAVIQVQERVLGAEHRDTLGSRMNLATALLAQGKHAEAELEHRVVIQVQERVLGAEHLDTLGSRNNLALALADQGKYAEAEQEHRAVLKVMERLLGAEHPDTLSSRSNLALALQAQGKNAEAEQEFRAVLKVQERVLGAEHPTTLMSRGNLGIALVSQSKHAEAEQEQRAVLKVMERLLGAEHPDTLAGRSNLAVALQAQSKNVEAEQEFRAVLNVQERVLGAEHPDTLMSRINLANAPVEQNKHAEVEQEHRAVLKVMERVLGAEHPHVATSCYNLALCLEAQQKLPEARVLMQRAEQIYTKVLGPDHSHTKAAKAARERLEVAVKGK